MLEDGAEILAEPISQIADMSLGSKFPEDCKTAKVRPIFKKGKNTKLKNYRPVITVIERAVHSQPIEHLEKHENIFDYLSHLSNQILKRFEARKSTGMILLDLQKAFDILDHQFF